MATRNSELIDQQGSFKTCKVELVDDETGKTVSVHYEVRKADQVLEEFETEYDALKEMQLQDRIARQDRPSGPGM